MRISHKHKFVFLSKWKSASESVRAALDPFSDVTSTQEYPYYHHTNANMLKKHFDESGWDWNEYNTIITIRNPWDMLVSLYYYGLPDKKGQYYWNRHWDEIVKDNYHPEFCVVPEDIVEFNTWIERFDLSQFSLDYFINDDAGNSLVKHVVPLESLSELDSILDLPEPIIIPHLNKTSHPATPYLYTEKSLKKVAKVFASDIKAGGYTPPVLKKKSLDHFKKISKKSISNLFLSERGTWNRWYDAQLESLKTNAKIVDALTEERNELGNLLSNERSALEHETKKLADAQQALEQEQASHGLSRAALEQEQASHGLSRAALEQEQISHGLTRTALDKEQRFHIAAQELLEKEQGAHAETQKELSDSVAAYEGMKLSLKNEQKAHSKTQSKLLSSRLNLNSAQSEIEHLQQSLAIEKTDHENRYSELESRHVDALNKVKLLEAGLQEERSALQQAFSDIERLRSTVDDINAKSQQQALDMNGQLQIEYNLRKAEQSESQGIIRELGEKLYIAQSTYRNHVLSLHASDAESRSGFFSRFFKLKLPLPVVPAQPVLIECGNDLGGCSGGSEDFFCHKPVNGSEAKYFTAAQAPVEHSAPKTLVPENAHNTKASGQPVAAPVPIKLTGFAPGLNVGAEQFEAGYGKHRSGWSYAINALFPLQNNNAIHFDTFIERTFRWHPDGPQVHRKPWVGVFHEPHNLPEWLAAVPGVGGAQWTLNSPEWNESLKYCRGLFAMSEYSSKFLRDTYPHLPVSTLVHPTEFPDVCWNPEAFLKNQSKKLIQIGWYLRNLHAIYELPVSSYTKIALPANKGLKFFEDLFKIEAEVRKAKGVFFESMYDTAEMLGFIPNDEYDKLLSENVGFLNLYDSSANNAVIECIARKTPLLVNPLPSVVEYLGADYPLYYTCYDQAIHLVEDHEKVIAAHEYLCELPIREQMSCEAFRNSILESDVYKRLDIAE
ncbi:MAG: hypothetical protein ACNI27_13155 [Desulfovibrio sp.]